MVFFDALEIKYEYEKEGFDLGNGVWYLPDFWLPQYEAWWEVKGTNPSKAEREKLVLLTEGTNKPAFLAWGEVSPPSFDEDSHNIELILPLTWNTKIDVPWSNGLTYGMFSRQINWACCERCGQIMLVSPVLQISQGIIIKKCDCNDAVNTRLDLHNCLIANAYLAARQARFEHRENENQ